ncbi:nucleoid-associated protein [Anoxybacter fermentans]|uniref:Nucleoid-associated protein BBF96_13940 n=1 Tax=Anoxybacter fermentans TaxID=1323375 RepID=A0A3S9T1J2_9FIRM|nr:YbaB/EbfC family nucleoid-associated protein [Anoxybacter fermentans]AZR74390.1 nucleoid-associated protein [Anoxybacter fermentans]
MSMNKMMKQLQQMQAKMMKLQEEIAKKTVEATAGGGAVKVVANGKLEIVDINIDPDAVDPDDVEMLEDLVLAAVNEALRKVQELNTNELSKLTGGLNIPGLF